MTCLVLDARDAAMATTQPLPTLHGAATSVFQVAALLLLAAAGRPAVPRQLTATATTRSRELILLLQFQASGDTHYLFCMQEQDQIDCTSGGDKMIIICSALYV